MTTVDNKRPNSNSLQATLLINGEWVTAHGDVWQTTNPVSQAVIWQGNAATAEDVEAACQAARQAFLSWAKKPISERIAIIERFAKLLEDNKTALAEIISQETSKPRWETLTEVQSMIGKV